MVEIKFKKILNSSKDENILITFFQDDFNLKNLGETLKYSIFKFIDNIDFKPFFGEYEILNLIAEGFPKIILFGLGKKEDFSSNKAKIVGSKICDIINLINVKNLNILSYCENIMIANMAFSIKIYSWEPKHYLNKSKCNEVNLNFICKNSNEVSQVFNNLNNLAESVIFGKNLISDLSSNLTKIKFIKLINDTLLPLNIEIEVINLYEVNNFNSNLLTSIFQDNLDNVSIMVIKWLPKKIKKIDVALVCEGILQSDYNIFNNFRNQNSTRSSISTIISSFILLAKNKINSNAIGTFIFSEKKIVNNLYEGNILTSLSGKKIEINNVHSIERLLLAEAISYTYEFYNPKYIISIISNSNEIIKSLSNGYAVYYTDNEDLSATIMKSSIEVDDKLWRLPILKDLENSLVSNMADLKNSNNKIKCQSAITAEFLRNFKKESKWVHINFNKMIFNNKQINKNFLNPFISGVELIENLLKEKLN